MLFVEGTLYLAILTHLNKHEEAQEAETESGCIRHLLEVGVFSVLDQLQQNSLSGGEVRSALLQPGQSKQTVCLAVEGHAKVATRMC